MANEGFGADFKFNLWDYGKQISLKEKSIILCSDSYAFLIYIPFIEKITIPVFTIAAAQVTNQ